MECSKFTYLCLFSINRKGTHVTNLPLGNGSIIHTSNRTRRKSTKLGCKRPWMRRESGCHQPTMFPGGKCVVYLHGNSWTPLGMTITGVKPPGGAGTFAEFLFGVFDQRRGLNCGGFTTITLKVVCRWRLTLSVFSPGGREVVNSSPAKPPREHVLVRMLLPERSCPERT